MAVFRYVRLTVAMLAVVAGGLLFSTASALAQYAAASPETFLTIGGAQAVAVNKATGNVYVGNEGGEVKEYNSEGVENVAFSLSEPGGVYQMAVDNSSTASKGDLYTADFKEQAPSEFGKVVQYNESGVATGKEVKGLGEETAVAVDSSGNVYIGIFSNPAKVYKFDSKLEKQELVLEGGQLINALAINAKGDLYAAEANAEGGVSMYEPEGAKFKKTPKCTLGSGPVAAPAGSFGVAVDAQGNVFADKLKAIEEFNEACAAVGTSFGGAGEPELKSDAINQTSKKLYAAASGAIYMFVPGPGGPPTLTVTKEGKGTGLVTSSPAGINCGTTCSAEFTEGEKVKLTEKPEGSSTFGGWTNCTEISATECEVTMSANVEVKAKFSAPKFKLTVAKSAEGEVVGSEGAATIACGATCEVEVEEGEKVTLTATGEAGKFSFKEWSGEECAKETTACTFTMTKAVTETAVYATSKTSPLSVFVIGGGEVNGGPISACKESGGTCKGEAEGAVTLTAKAETGKVFAGWMGPCVKATATTCEVDVTSATFVYAAFLTEGKEGKAGIEGKEGKEGKAGKEGKEGLEGEEGIPGAEGKEGKEGPAGKTGPTGPAGPAGAAGKQGPAGPAGPAGKVELVTCVKKGKKKKCRTKLISGVAKISTAHAARARLSRNGVTLAAGIARVGHGHLSLRLRSLHRLATGRYKLTLTSGSGSHTSTVSEVIILS